MSHQIEHFLKHHWYLLRYFSRPCPHLKMYQQRLHRQTSPDDALYECEPHQKWATCLLREVASCPGVSEYVVFFFPGRMEVTRIIWNCGIEHCHFLWVGQQVTLWNCGMGWKFPSGNCWVEVENIMVDYAFTAYWPAIQNPWYFRAWIPTLSWWYPKIGWRDTSKPSFSC